MIHSAWFFFFFNIYFWLCWVFVAARRLSLVAVSGGYSLLWASYCGGSSCCRAQALGVRAVVVAPGLSCSAACGIFPDQGSNPCPLHWQADSFSFLNYFIVGCIGSSLLHVGFLLLRWAGATLHCGAWASHCGGFSCCGARALGTRTHVGSSRARARTRDPCIGRQILNHCATREVRQEDS